MKILLEPTLRAGVDNSERKKGTVVNNISYMDNLPTDLHEQHYSILTSRHQAAAVSKRRDFSSQFVPLPQL